MKILRRFFGKQHADIAREAHIHGDGELIGGHTGGRIEVRNLRAGMDAAVRSPRTVDANLFARDRQQRFVELLLDGNVITASAGCTLMQLCRFAQKNQLAGLEFAYGIPGTVGGAVYMNAGAYGGEMKDVVRDVTLLQKDGHIAKLSGSEMQFRYRHSILEDSGACVLHVCFALAPGDEKMISARMEELMARRREKQPLDKPSAGSTFKRPEGAFAAALIEQCGLRGYRVGGAAISEKHCGFVVNLGGASCADVLCLCRDVTEAVKGKTGYALEKEVRVVGD